MTFEQAMNQICELTPQLLNEYGISVDGTRDAQIRCVDSENHKHGDRNPSAHYYARTNTVYCFSCGTTHNAFTLIRKLYNINDSAERFRKGCELCGIDFNTIEKDSNFNIAKAIGRRQAQDEDEIHVDERTKAYSKKCNDAVKQNVHIANYLMLERGINRETVREFADNGLIGFDENYFKFNYPAIVFISDTGAYNARIATDEIAPQEDGRRPQKTDKPKNQTQGIFNSRRLEQTTENVFICEGEINALSIETVGGKAIATAGATTINKAVKQIVNRKRDNQLFFIAFDNDDTGRKKSHELETALQKNGVNCYNITDESGRNFLTGDVNDVNDALKANRELFKSRVQHLNECKTVEDVKKYFKQIQFVAECNVQSYMLSFFKYIKDTKRTPTPTGFERLDKALNGGLTTGLYTVFAPPGMGKTTFCLNIANNIARHTEKGVIYISLEMSTEELISRSVSRLSFMIDSETNGVNSVWAKSESEITNGNLWDSFNDDEIALLNKSVESFSEYNNRLFVYESVTEKCTVSRIKQLIALYESIYHELPIVFIDFVQMLAVDDDFKDDRSSSDIRMIVDDNITKLKRLSRDKEMTIVVLSSCNRNENGKDLTFASIKESSMIESTSSVAIALQYHEIRNPRKTSNGDGKEIKIPFDEDRCAKEYPRKIDVRILKNRQGERATIAMNYYSRYSFMQEMPINGIEYHGEKKPTKKAKKDLTFEDALSDIIL